MRTLAEDFGIENDSRNMITILFWNLKQKDKAEKKQGETAEAFAVRQANIDKAFAARQANLLRAVGYITEAYTIDILLFAEFHLNIEDLLTRLTKLNMGNYHFIPTSIQPDTRKDVPPQDKKVTPRKIQIFTRMSPDRLSEVSINDLSVKGVPITDDKSVEIPMRNADLGETALSLAFFHDGRFEHPRLTLNRLLINSKTDLLLAAAHLIPKSEYDALSQREEARRISQRIRFAEQHIVRHARTIIVGDFNMNPTEEGMTLPDAFHSVTRARMPESKDTVGIQGFE